MHFLVHLIVYILYSVHYTVQYALGLLQMFTFDHVLLFSSYKITFGLLQMVKINK